MSRRPIPRRAVLGSGAALFALAGAPGVPSLVLGQTPAEDASLIGAIEDAAEPLPPIAAPDFAAFADRFANARVVLLGESTHGTDEFYRARAAITERLVTRHGYEIVAAEADWPDAARIDAYIRGRAELPSPIGPFQRFPAWMWRNRAARDFVDRLHAINRVIEAPERRVGFYGLDLYSLPSSMDAVVDFVRRHDPAALDEVRALWLPRAVAGRSGGLRCAGAEVGLRLVRGRRRRGARRGA